ncbi:D-alanine--D-alanine ligase family protein [Desulfurella multipotens]|uniref:D-alanine--D-alanine ligase family protein n=1 Tax=Desulfurella TaxID=33001 RepID=UPI000CC6280B|nr:D-alanine--D-alanine ligase [Desulfurella multipotens]PMP67272.1 MAG: D-alanine--D-alanine ligase [Desulfurella multipotens]
MSILVVCGGDSSEREVSIRSGSAIHQALLNLKYDAQKYICENKKDCIETILKKKPDVVFIALHGGFGEDGTLQAALEMHNIKYTGSNSLTSKVCMNKFFTKAILKEYHIPTKPAVLAKDIKDIININSFPVCIKPNNEGSSIGVEFAYDDIQLKAKFSELIKQFKELIIEEKITGTEVTLSMINSECLPLIEIAPKKGFYDYQNKYTSGATEYIIPARINQSTIDEINRIGKTIYKAFYCKGAIRIDMMIEKNIPYVLEINTIPGMTQTSLLPNAAKSVNINFEMLVEKILKSAYEGF